jgi:hypothetical protein
MRRKSDKSLSWLFRFMTGCAASALMRSQCAASSRLILSWCRQARMNIRASFIHCRQSSEFTGYFRRR